MDPNLYLRKFKIHAKLLDAFLSEDFEKIRRYVSRGADVNHYYPRLNYATLLHHSQTVEMMKELLNLGADTHARALCGFTPLHSYVSFGKSQLAIELIRLKADVNVKNYCGETPLHLAIIYKRGIDLVRELLKSGADINEPDIRYYSPLNYALIQCSNADVCKELLEYGGSLRIWQELRNLNLEFFKEPLMMGNVGHIQFFIRFTVLKHEKLPSVVCFGCFPRFPNYVMILVYMNECTNEVRKMKKDKIGSKSLYDIVVGNDGNIKPLNLRNKTEVYFRTKYKIYSHMILDKLQYWLMRAKLLRSLKYISRSNSFCNVLNYDCIHKLVEYLPNDDLSNLIKAFMLD